MLITGNSCASFTKKDETSLFFCLYNKKLKQWKCSNSDRDFILETEEELEDLVCMPSIDHQNYVWGCDYEKKGN